MKDYTITLGLLSLFAAFKGLGGSFHSLFEYLQLTSWHGPIVGGLICMCFILFFLSYDEPASLPTPSQRSPHTPSFWMLTAGWFVLVASALYLRIDAILTIPLDVNRADMLPTVLAGLDSLFQGQTPYQSHILANAKLIPHYFPPLLWLPYLPFYALNLDIRWLNILAHAVFYFVLWHLSQQTLSDSKTNWKTCLVLWLVVGLHAFSKQMVQQVIDLHTGSFWLCYSLLLWGVITHKHRLLPFLVIGVLLSRETGILLLLPYWVYLFKTDKSKALRITKVILILASLVIFPFLLISPSGFFASIYHYGVAMNSASIEQMNRFYGWAGLLKSNGVFFLQKPLQLMGVLTALGLLGCRRYRSPTGALALGGVAYLLCILWVPVTWHYVYTLPIQLASVLTVLRR